MRYERVISRVLLISILIALLLNINFSIWSVSFYEGDIENQVRQELRLIGESGKVDSTRSELVERTNQNLSAHMLFIIGILFVFCSFSVFIIVKYPIKISYPNTLIALSVRLND